MDFQTWVPKEQNVIPPSWKTVFMSIQLTGEGAGERGMCTRETLTDGRLADSSLVMKQDAQLELQARY